LPHLEDILSIKEIDSMQWVPGAGQPPTYEWMDLLKRFQKAGKSVQIYDWPLETIKALHKELDPALVFYCCWASSRDEADAFLDWLKANT
jgi:5-methyltetrahydrofolate--homocysteine methyltransferase